MFYEFLSVELEKLNQSTDDINRCETELEEARQKFRSVLVEATVKLDELVKKIGKAVEESKPYWEARRLARQAQLEAQKATQDFHRATEVLQAAKETIFLAEQRLLEEDNRQFDSAWQEMLNHATQRVMEAEHTKTRSELVHKEIAAKYKAAINRMKQLEKKLKRTISKSKPYFEMKAKYYLQLEHLKKTVDEQQAKLSQAKGKYKTALTNLEMISDEIHERRRNSSIGPRVRGVGAEGDSIFVEDISSFTMESDGISMTSQYFEDEACGGGSIMSEEDSETRSTCSLGSSPSSPQDLLSPCTLTSISSSSYTSFSSASPSPTPSSVSLSDFGLISPVLGPRSECSGASSPECDLERDLNSYWRPKSSTDVKCLITSDPLILSIHVNICYKMQFIFSWSSDMNHLDVQRFRSERGNTVIFYNICSPVKPMDFDQWQWKETLVFTCNY
uniref:SH3 domain-binding protein 5 n=1 Tax=Sphaeramia orbicularis TaxID=375764 RepID=A0A672ZCQ7_9TELE